jgi:hypothetical protein
VSSLQVLVPGLVLALWLAHPPHLLPLPAVPRLLRSLLWRWVLLT